MKKSRVFPTVVFMVILAVTAMWAVVFVPNMPVHAQQGTYFPPTVYQATTTTVGWNAGILNNGGHAVTITAGTSAVTTSKADCSLPVAANCNFVYANSSGTVAVTTTQATALASGNVLMAYVETSGSAITGITYPNQSSIPGNMQYVAQACGTTSTCASTYVGPALKVAYGTVALVSASPSAATVASFSPAFTSSTSYSCSASPVGTSAAVAAAGIAVNITSGTSVTFTGPNTVTTVINYVCYGQ